MPSRPIYKASTYQQVGSLIGVDAFLRKQGVPAVEVPLLTAKLQSGNHRYVQTKVGERTIRIEQLHSKDQS